MLVKGSGVLLIQKIQKNKVLVLFKNKNFTLKTRYKIFYIRFIK